MAESRMKPAPMPEVVAESPGVASYWKAASGGQGGYAFVSLVGLKDLDPLEILTKVRRGLPFRSLVLFLENTGLSMSEVADLVSIPPRTLQRRKAEGRLEPEESDRLLRATRVFARALDLFEGDAVSARDWFHTPARALGGEQPIQLTRTDIGSREVEALIDRLEHGVLT